jgi:cell division protein FtsA
MRSASTRPGITGVLDIGTTKVVCLIASQTAQRGHDGLAARPGSDLRILGVGHQRSGGVKAGVVIDLEDAERCIRAAIAQAERMAGVTLDHVFVSIACGRLKSQTFSASADIAGPRVKAHDVARMMAGARSYVERDGRKLVHINRKAMQLDGNVCDGLPVGLAARQMTADIHAVSADEAPLRNLMMVLERCHLGVAGLSVAPFSSALAVTTAEERQLGTTVIDIGSGITKLATFTGGQLTGVRSAAFGGGSITAAIAHALHTPLIEAERIKALYGNLLSARSDEHEGFSYPLAGSDEGVTHHATRAQLASVIRPVVVELLQSVANPSSPASHAEAGGHPLVLTGGGCQLTGIAEFTSHVLQRPVRIGQTAAVSGLPPIARTPAFSTATGLLFASEGHGELATAPTKLGEDCDGGYVQRVGAWLKSGF